MTKKTRAEVRAEVRAQLRAFIEEMIRKRVAASKRSRDDIDRQFRKTAKRVHPDVGGNAAAFRRAVERRDAALEAIGTFEEISITSHELYDLASDLRPDHSWTWRELRLAVIRRYGLTEDDAKRLIAGFSRSRRSLRWRFFVDRTAKRNPDAVASGVGGIQQSQSSEGKSCT
jgi:curved DNA-binding protein CbpA